MKPQQRIFGRLLMLSAGALALVALALWTGNRTTRRDDGWTDRERLVINESDSVMYVTVLPEDSVLLRTPSVDLSAEQLASPELRTLMAKMRATVQSPQQDGVGIAAPQVGIDRRLIWIQRFDKPGEPFECYLNPHLDSVYGAMTHGPEGCLSVPPMRGHVPRYGSVIVSYLHPETLLPQKDTVHGYTAIIFQHECDHLDGTLYIDRADTLFVSIAWADERAAYDYARPAWWPDICLEANQCLRKRCHELTK